MKKSILILVILLFSRSYFSKLFISLLVAIALPTAVNANLLDSRKNLFGKYHSKVDAYDACFEWMDKGFHYQYEYGPQYNIELNKTTYKKSKKKSNRWCYDEEETKTIIGLEDEGRNQAFYTYHEENQYKNEHLYREDSKIVIKKRYHY
tara:strand:+ start:472 stop:918 length:447 start_codon:yes stop_codon:yes gene_type:complete